jgi:hypothetical protein
VIGTGGGEAPCSRLCGLRVVEGFHRDRRPRTRALSASWESCDVDGDVE